MGPVAGLRAKLNDVFTADLRSLSAFRIALASAVLLDLAYRAQDLTAHYSDAGVLPRAELLGHHQLVDSWTISINLISGSAAVQGVLFALAALAAVGMLTGFATRLMTLLTWLLVLSIGLRNPLIGGGGEVMLRVLLFWSLFLPLGACWSLDRRRGAVPAPTSTRVTSIPVAALFLQIAFVYWFAFLLKSGPEWRWDGSALQYALNIDQLAKPAGIFLRDFPAVLTVLTFSVLAIESLGPFLLLSPFKPGLVRTVGVGLFMSLQLGIFLMLGMGTFPAIAGGAMVCFLPTEFWDRIQRRTSRDDPAAAARLHVPRAVNLGVGVLIAYVLFWNITTVTPLAMPQPIRHLGPALGISQDWNMFAPSPLRDDGWYVMPGSLANGRRVDVAGVLRGDESLRQVSFRNPDDIRATYSNEHWRKYLEVLRLQHREQHRFLARYVCREWNTNHAPRQRLVSLAIAYMGKATRLRHSGPPELRTLWVGTCA